MVSAWCWHVVSVYLYNAPRGSSKIHIIDTLYIQYKGRVCFLQVYSKLTTGVSVSVSVYNHRSVWLLLQL